MYPRYQSRSGYFNQDDQTDGYGVDHSGFSLRDELLYQTTRNKREQELVKNYNQRGIDYPQFGSNFWGDSADNYGFGRSNIENNIPLFRIIMLIKYLLKYKNEYMLILPLKSRLQGIL